MDLHPRRHRFFARRSSIHVLPPRKFKESKIPYAGREGIRRYAVLLRGQCCTGDNAVFPENRFQRNNLAGQRAFVPADPEARASPSALEEKDGKASIQHAENSAVSEGGVITQEVEVFEWREVRRGKILSYI